jgi:hypothetical protein
MGQQGCRCPPARSRSGNSGRFVGGPDVNQMGTERPAGSGKASIRRSMLPNRRHVSGSPPAAASSSEHALPTGRRSSPAGAASKEHFSTPFANASRRHRLPRLYASRSATAARRSTGPTATEPRHFTACLPSLIPDMASLLQAVHNAGANKVVTFTARAASSTTVRRSRKEN